jgi:hypothetical protein
MASTRLASVYLRLGTSLLMCRGWFIHAKLRSWRKGLVREGPQNCTRQSNLLDCALAILDSIDHVWLHQVRMGTSLCFRESSQTNPMESERHIGRTPGLKQNPNLVLFESFQSLCVPKLQLHFSTARIHLTPQINNNGFNRTT